MWDILIDIGQIGLVLIDIDDARMSDWIALVMSVLWSWSAGGGGSGVVVGHAVVKVSVVGVVTVVAIVAVAIGMVGLVLGLLLAQFLPRLE